jgi:hypothetical protein
LSVYKTVDLFLFTFIIVGDGFRILHASYIAEKKGAELVIVSSPFSCMMMMSRLRCQDPDLHNNKRMSSLQSIAFSQEHKLVPSGDPSVSSCPLSTPGLGTTYEGVVVVFFHRATDFAGAIDF